MGPPTGFRIFKLPLQLESLRDTILVEVTGDDAAISGCTLAPHPHQSHGPGSCLLLSLVMLLMPAYRGPTDTGH